jgi:nitrogen fixation/metabolism regulation signal transduction histidine kinase
MSRPVNRRRFYRVLLSPRFQLKFGAYFTAVAAAIMGMWGGLALYFMMAVISFNSKTAKGMPLGAYVTELLQQHAALLLGAFFVTTFLFLCLGVILTERIAGPSRALLRHIEALKEGRFEHKTTLRKNDELKHLGTALNELSEALSTGQIKPSSADERKAG